MFGLSVCFFTEQFERFFFFFCKSHKCLDYFVYKQLLTSPHTHTQKEKKFIFAILLFRFFFFILYSNSSNKKCSVSSYRCLCVVCLRARERKKKKSLFIGSCFFFTCLTVFFSVVLSSFCVFNKRNCEIKQK